MKSKLKWCSISDTFLCLNFQKREFIKLCREHFMGCVCSRGGAEIDKYFFFVSEKFQFSSSCITFKNQHFKIIIPGVKFTKVNAEIHQAMTSQFSFLAEFLFEMFQLKIKIAYSKRR